MNIEMKRRLDKAANEVRRYGQMVDEIGARLAAMNDGNPEERGITEVFHEACNRLNAAQEEVGAFEAPLERDWADHCTQLGDAK
jgi:hypothetical protein